MREVGQRVYDVNFARRLRADVARLHRMFPELGPPNLPKSRTLFDFDDHYTAPRNGFAGADDYYARSSVAPRIPEIEVPGLVVHAADDPFIPAETFRRVPFPSHLALELITGGGHLGYLSHRPWMGARRWLDARITAWLATRWALESNRPDAPGPVVAGFAGRR
jgi:predicted alpha/beta-fold hydrolase